MIKWYDISERSEKLRSINIIIGGRGIGKTYSAITYVVESGKPFLYLRNTMEQMKESATPFGNPFKRWGRDHGRDIRIVPEKSHFVIYEYKGDADREQIGYGVALSTFESLRGVDLSDIEYVLFDEFIEHRLLHFKQFDAFANFYETVNRNRELMGEKALCCILLSNAQKLDNQILAGYGCIPIIERMIKDAKSDYVSKYMYINLPNSEVSVLKKDTLNYRLTTGTRFYDEAVNNLFANESFAGIKKQNILEYIPVCGIDDIFIYRRKSGSGLYICRTYNNTVAVYSSRDSKLKFMRMYGLMLKEYIAAEKVTYSDFEIKSKIFRILDIL